MKSLFTLVVVLFSTAMTQAQDVVGTYSVQFDINGSGVIKRTLTLKPDGTFTFHWYRQTTANAKKETKFGKGTWTQNKKIITFFTSEEDFDDTHTLDFNTTKARYHSKHPRDKSDKIVKTSLTIFSSKIFWLENSKLFKQ